MMLSPAEFGWWNVRSNSRCSPVRVVIVNVIVVESQICINDDQSIRQDAAQGKPQNNQT
jgi:hypothetical protein